jgi:hypothetical protein
MQANGMIVDLSGWREGGARLSGREDEFICERLQVYDEDFMSSTCKQIACDLSACLRDDCLALSSVFMAPFVFLLWLYCCSSIF